MKKKITFLIFLLSCVLIFGVSYLILTSNKTTKAVVLNVAVDPGVTITSDMVSEIEIPENTPAGFLKNKKSIIGYKSKTRIEKEQLLYVSNFMSSWTNYSDANTIPEDYVITSVSIPDERACGGVITQGDYVDIMAVFRYNASNSAWSGTESTAQQIYGTGRSDTGTTVSFILSNVYVLNTNSSLSKSQKSDVSVSSAEGSSGGNSPFYIFALSYDDYKKLRQVEGVDGVELWMNIAPSQNQVEGNSPLIKQMLGQSYSYLHDAQVPVQDKEGNMITDNYYIPGEDDFNKDNTGEYKGNISEQENQNESNNSSGGKSGKNDLTIIP